MKTEFFYLIFIKNNKKFYLNELTILFQLVLKKDPAEPIKSNPEFARQVFGQEGAAKKQEPNITNIGKVFFFCEIYLYAIITTV